MNDVYTFCPRPLRKCLTKTCQLYGRTSTKGYCRMCYSDLNSGKRRPEKQRLITEYVIAKKDVPKEKVTIHHSTQWTLQLPLELWVTILTQNLHLLDVWSIGRLQFVNKDFYHLVNSYFIMEALWRYHNPLEFEQLIAGVGEFTGTSDRDLMLLMREENGVAFLKSKLVDNIFTCEGCGLSHLRAENADIEPIYCECCSFKVCDEADCMASCGGCDRPMCKACETFCVSCGAAKHCEADKWRECRRCVAPLCPNCKLCKECGTIYFVCMSHNDFDAEWEECSECYAPFCYLCNEAGGSMCLECATTQAMQRDDLGGVQPKKKRRQDSIEQKHKLSDKNKRFKGETNKGGEEGKRF